MSSWSSKRKFLYGGTLAVIILAIAGYVVFANLYQAPTCFDGIKNGDETGVDCGGSCQRLCPSAFLAPIISWKSFSQLGIGTYNAAAYVINPNNNGTAINVPYHFVLYDINGDQIVDVPGRFNIPPHRNTLAFLGPISVGKRVPYKVFFEFTGSPDWQQATDTLASLSIGPKKYTEDKYGSSLLVTLRNNSVKPLSKMDIYVSLFDSSSNVIGFSKTIIDGISGLGSVDAPFTWPVSHNGKVVSIEVLPVAE